MGFLKYLQIKISQLSYYPFETYSFIALLFDLMLRTIHKTFKSPSMVHLNSENKSLLSNKCKIPPIGIALFLISDQ